MASSSDALVAKLRARARSFTNLRLYDKGVIETNEAVDIKRDQNFMAIYERCKPFTMTSIERMYALHTAVNYIVDNDIAGDIVETGVWRGGSTMMAALTLLSRDAGNRDLWLYDTFEGMVEPTEADSSYDGRSAQIQYLENPDWCAASREDVETNMRSTGYAAERLHYIAGKVEETIPSAGVPAEIALLRLDTDWYVSNKHELENLYPLLAHGGVLLIDDYGHWDGVRRSVDEYFREQGITGLLNRIDYTGRLLIKQ